MQIPDFISRCDAFCAARGQSRVWLSKRLFNDTFKLDNLAGGRADIGVRRLAKACADLAALEDGGGVHGCEVGHNGVAVSEKSGAVFTSGEPGSSVEAAA